LPYLAVLRRNCTSLRVTIVIVFCIASTPRNIGAPLHLVIARDLSLLSDSTLAWPSTHAPPCLTFAIKGFIGSVATPFHGLRLSYRYQAYVFFYSLSLVLVVFVSQVFYSVCVFFFSLWPSKVEHVAYALSFSLSLAGCLTVGRASLLSMIREWHRQKQKTRKSLSKI
jgi:hypothetical protein